MGSKLNARFNETDIKAAIDSAVASIEVGQRPLARPRNGFVASRRSLTPIEAVKRSSASRINGADPDALEKLEAKLASMHSLSENMQRTNEFLRNQDRAGLIRYGYSAEGVEELFLRGPGQQLGYSVQELNNMAANIDRVIERIAEVKRNLVRKTIVVQENGYQYAEDVAEHRVMFMFPEKPITTVRQLLGKSGFRWSPNRGSWVRPLNSNTISAAEAVRAELNRMSANINENKKITLH